VKNIDRRTVLSGLGALCLGGTTSLTVASPAAADTFHGATAGAAAEAAPAVPVSPVPRLTQPRDFVTLAEVRTNRAAIALTFDDGPHPVHTPILLDILARYNAKATFYVVGQMARRSPDILRRIVAEGHELGNHSWTHPMLSQMGNATFMREIDRTQEVIWRAVGAVPVTMRPPYGAITGRQSNMLDSQRNIPTIMWSVDTQDYRRPGPSVVAARMVNGARPGAVILAHDIHGPTVRAVPAALEGIAARGLEAVTMSELLGWNRWGPRGQRVVRSNPAIDWQG
tara:strand:+ start:1120 stop:1968 length:849 start_codon:yes stop_codon:yes gene_type:complete